MKKIFASIVLFSTMLNGFSQNRICPSSLNMAAMQQQDPARYQRFMDLENFTANYISNQGNLNQRLINPNGIITIPVVVHVLHRGESVGTGRNISDAQIQSQIDVLNEDFRRLNADRTNTPAAFTPIASDCNFEFRLACQDPNGNTTNGIRRVFTTKTSFAYSQICNPNTPNLCAPDEQAIGAKFTSQGGDDAWATDRYLNIWVCDFIGGVLGYATFPADFATNPNVDGVVIETTAMGRTGNVTAPFNLGRTATHEVGHWLNLRHITGDAECGDDFVGDTPQQRNQNYGCPGFPHASDCPNNGINGDMFMNYMDYTDDGCMNIYTNGQRLRGRAIFATGGPRAAFVDNYFSIEQPTTPISCIGTVRLNNPNCFPVTWSVISGPATITSSTNTGAVLNISAPGTVSLRATGGNYISDININVNQNAPPTPGQITFPLIDPEFGKIQASVEPVAGATSYKWYKNGVLITNPPAQGTFIQFPISSQCDIEYDISVEAINSCGASSQSHANAYVPCDNYYLVSPNPATSDITVSTNESKTQSISSNTFDEVRIYDLQGTLKKYQKFNKVKTAMINIAGLTNGTYFVEIINGAYKEKKQLLIQK